MERADLVGTRPPGHFAPQKDRNVVALLDADLAAEKDEGRRTSRASAAKLDRLPEVEDAGAFEEEIAKLREEQAEPRQVDLLLVRLHLREVRVVGEVQREAGREAVLQVQAGFEQRLFRGIQRAFERPAGAAQGEGRDLESGPVA